MSKGITPIIAIILLLLVTISITGFALIFFQRTTETASQQAETELEHQAGMMGQNFVIEGADDNKVYIRNLDRQELKNLNFYVNGAKIDSTGTVPSGQVGTITLNDAQLAQMPNDAKLKVSSLGTSREESVQFYKDEVVGYWKFDEADRDKATDYSGNGNDGTFCCESWNDGTLKSSCPNCPQQADGKFGKALSFDGIDDYAEAADSDSLSPNKISAFGWIRLASIPSAGTSYYLLKKTGEYYVEVYPSSYAIYVVNQAGSQVSVQGGTPEKDKWIHFGFTWDNNRIRLYINGQEINSVPHSGTSVQNAGSPLQIGIGSNDYFDGLIDEVRIYNRVLSPEEIQEDMNSAYPINRAVASYSFENGAKDTHNIVKGRFGAALSFDGAGDFVKILGFGNVAPTSEITIETWVNLGEVKNQDILSFDPLNDDYGRITVHFPWGSNILWQFGKPFETASLPISAVPAGTWQHFTFVASASGNFMKIYKNGDLAATTPSMRSFNRYPGDWHIGGRSDSTFNGVIDEVRILNVARPMG